MKNFRFRSLSSLLTGIVLVGLGAGAGEGAAGTKEASLLPKSLLLAQATGGGAAVGGIRVGTGGSGGGGAPALGTGGSGSGAYRQPGSGFLPSPAPAIAPSGNPSFSGSADIQNITTPQPPLQTQTGVTNQGGLIPTNQPLVQPQGQLPVQQSMGAPSPGGLVPATNNLVNGVRSPVLRTNGAFIVDASGILRPNTNRVNATLNTTNLNTLRNAALTNRSFRNTNANRFRQGRTNLVVVVTNVPSPVVTNVPAVTNAVSTVLTNIPVAGQTNVLTNALTLPSGFHFVTNAEGTGYQLVYSASNQTVLLPTYEYYSSYGGGYGAPGVAGGAGGMAGAYGSGPGATTAAANPPGTPMYEAAGTPRPQGQVVYVTNFVMLPQRTLTPPREEDRNLRTLPADLPPDAGLSTRILSILQWDDALPESARTVKVGVTGGTVLLYGQVGDADEARTIAQRIGQIPGVTRVENDLRFRAD